jgi:hypothetical protein
MHKTGRVQIDYPTPGKKIKCHLVKYEKLSYETLRVGTLEYYRNLEGRQGDPFDGRVEGVVFEPGQVTRVSREEMLTISAGSLDVVTMNGGLTFGESARYQDERSRRCNNVYVFCCSVEFGGFPDALRKNHFEASENFVVGSVGGLMKSVEASLWGRAKSTEGEYLDQAKHYCVANGAPVRYLPRKAANFELPLNVLDFFVYQKDPKFQLEQEYRFSWGFYEKRTHRPVEVAEEPIDILKSNISCIIKTP